MKYIQIMYNFQTFNYLYKYFPNLLLLKFTLSFF